MKVQVHPTAMASKGKVGTLGSLCDTQVSGSGLLPERMHAEAPVPVAPVAAVAGLSMPGQMPLQRVNCLDALEFQRLLDRLFGPPGEHTDDSDGLPVGRTFAVVPSGSLSPCAGDREHATWADPSSLAASCSMQLAAEPAAGCTKSQAILSVHGV